MDPLGTSECRGVGSEEDGGRTLLARLNSSCNSGGAGSSDSSCSFGSSFTSACDGSDLVSHLHPLFPSSWDGIKHHLVAPVSQVLPLEAGSVPHLGL